MKRSESAIPLRFQTPVGEAKLTHDDLSSDLEAIDYRTGREIPLGGIVALPPAPIYNLSFSDGRRGLYRGDGNIYLGGKVIPIAEVIGLIARLSPGPSRDFYRHLDDGEKIVILTDNEALRLEMNGTVQFASSEYLNRPDPYSAGCLLPVGDFAKPYVNLPSDRTDSLEAITVSNHWEVTAGDTVDNLGFKLIGDHDDNRVGWQDFMHSHEGIELRDLSSSRITRSDYLIAPITDRVEFLRGFFDTNYLDLELEGGLKRVELEPEVSIPYYGWIKFIRDVMFSLGIGSRLTSLRSGRNKSQYGLQPRCQLRDFARLFNRVEKAERLLAAAEKEPFPRDNSVYLRSIELVFHATGTYNVIAENGQQVVYLGTNFLPKVSYVS